MCALDAPFFMGGKTVNKVIRLKKRRAAALIFIVGTVLLTAFIWLHSLMPATISAQESGNVLSIAEMLLRALNLNPQLNDFIIRKAAHFSEFFALSIMVTSSFKLYYGSIKKYVFHILFTLLMIPVADESLQYLSPGRSAQVSDILLDFSGCITGMLLTCAATLLIHKVRKNRKERIMR